MNRNSVPIRRRKTLIPAHCTWVASALACLLCLATSESTCLAFPLARQQQDAKTIPAAELIPAKQRSIAASVDSQTKPTDALTPDQQLSHEKAVQVFERAIKARGGFEALEGRFNRHAVYQVKSDSETWHWENYQQNGNFLGFHDYGDRVSKWRVESFVPLALDQPVEGVVWSESGSTVRPRADAFGSVYATQRAFVTFEPNWQRQFKRLEYVGTENVREHTVHHVRMLNFKDVWTSRYYDVDTGLVIRSTRPNYTDPNRPDTIIDYYDYLPQGKYKDHLLSTRQVININGRILEYKLEKYEFNIQMPDFVFAVPQSMKTEVERIKQLRRQQQVRIANEQNRLRAGNNKK